MLEFCPRYLLTIGILVYVFSSNLGVATAQVVSWESLPQYDQHLPLYDSIYCTCDDGDCSASNSVDANWHIAQAITKFKKKRAVLLRALRAETDKVRRGKIKNKRKHLKEKIDALTICDGASGVEQILALSGGGSSCNNREICIQSAGPADFNSLEVSFVDPLGNEIYKLPINGYGFIPSCTALIVQVENPAGVFQDGFLQPVEIINENKAQVNSPIVVNQDFTAHLTLVTLPNCNGIGKLVFSNTYPMLVSGADLPDGGGGPSDPPNDEICSTPKITAPHSVIFSDLPPPDLNGNYTIEIEGVNFHKPPNGSDQESSVLFAKLISSGTGPSIPYPFSFISSTLITIKVPDPFSADVEFGMINQLGESSCGSNLFVTSFFNSPGSGGDDDDDDTTPSDVNVPLYTLETLPFNTEGVSRSYPIVAGGIPFPKGVVFEINGRPELQVIGATHYQVRTLTRDPQDGSVRWALPIFTVPELQANEIDASIVIVPGPGVSSGSFIAAATESLASLNTGPLQVTVPINLGSLLTSVTVDGAAIVTPNSGTSVLGFSTTGLPLYAGTDTTFTIEENGPARGVLRFDGSLRTTAGDASTRIVDFTLRMTASRNQRGIDINMNLRNDDQSKPNHIVFADIRLPVTANVGANPVVKIAKPANQQQVLAGFTAGQNVSSYIGFTNADVEGAGSSNYVPSCLRKQAGNITPKGTEIVLNGSTTLHSFDSQGLAPAYPYIQASGAIGGVTVASRRLPWGSRFNAESTADGIKVTAMPKSTHVNGEDCYVRYHQHASTDTRFEFHAGAAPDPVILAKRFYHEVYSIAQDYLQYGHADGYKLVSVPEANAIYTSLGWPHQVTAENSDEGFVVYRYKSEPGGSNNHEQIEMNLHQDLRFTAAGTRAGGKRLNAMNFAHYKIEDQIIRTKGVYNENISAQNGGTVLVSSQLNHDQEHLWMKGVWFWYLLTGNPLFLEAAIDLAEYFPTTDFWGPHTRVAARLLDESHTVMELLRGAGVTNAALENWVVDYFNWVDASDSTPTTDLNVLTNIGWNWISPGSVSRPVWQGITTSSGCGNQYSERGFMVGNFLAVAMYQIGHVQGVNPLNSNDIGYRSWNRLKGIAEFTRTELLPGAGPYLPGSILSAQNQAALANMHLAYEYCPNPKQFVEVENLYFHSVAFGLTEAGQQSGNFALTRRAIEEGYAFATNSTMAGSNRDIENVESQKNYQHALFRIRQCLANPLCRAEVQDLLP